jgi:hypothetical protein
LSIGRLPGAYETNNGPIPGIWHILPDGEKMTDNFPADKSEIRKQYEQRVYLIAHTYSDEIEQINIKYKNAIKEGKVLPDDKSRYQRNMAEIRSFKKRDKNLKIAYKNYLATGETSPELRAIYAYAFRVGRGQCTAQTDSGKYFKTKILENTTHKVYISIDRFIKQVAPDVYAFKAAAGYIILLSNDNPLRSVLFTDSPFEDVKE